MATGFSDRSPLSEGSHDETLALIDGRDSLKTQLTGAKLSLKLGGVQILNSFNARRFDGKPAVTHPCTPNFGPYGKDEFGLPQHGPARNHMWNLVAWNPGLQGGKGIVSYEVKAPPYPLVEVTQGMSLDHGVFRIETTHENKDTSPAPVVFGEHLYWVAGYGGWDNVTLNGERISKGIQENGGVPLQRENTLVIPGHAVISLRQENMPHAVLWSMPHADGGKYDRLYFCLEPVEFQPEQFGNPETYIEPGQKRTSSFEIAMIKDMNAQ
jgi:galactose mutarotase-like enzyme